jgi:hypothetical protein
VSAGGADLGGDLRRKLDVLRGHCAAVGRDYAEIEKTVGWAFDPGDDPASGSRDFLAALTGLLPDIRAIEVTEDR